MIKRILRNLKTATPLYAAIGFFMAPCYYLHVVNDRLPQRIQRIPFIWILLGLLLLGLVVTVVALLEAFLPCARSVWGWLAKLSRAVLAGYVKARKFFLRPVIVSVLSDRNEYRKAFWLAESTGDIKKMSVLTPANLASFRYARSYVSVKEVADNHWRAGLTFEIPGRQEYIFHVHEDSGSSGLLKTRILLQESGREVRDVKNDLPERQEVRELHLEVKRNVADKLIFLIDGEEAGSFEVPLRDISKLYFAAWADDKPFKVEFRDMEVAA